MNESTAKFTPGPWTMRDHARDEQCIYIESEADGVASVFTDASENGMANACIIAAAPELYSALHQATTIISLYAAALDTAVQNKTGKPYDENQRGVMETLKNYAGLMAKARGEQVETMK